MREYTELFILLLTLIETLIRILKLLKTGGKWKFVIENPKNKISINLSLYGIAF